MPIVFQAVNNNGKVVGIGANEKNNSVFSKLAFNIKGLKNSAFEFLGLRKKDNLIGEKVNLTFSKEGNLKNYNFIKIKNIGSEKKEATLNENKIKQTIIDTEDETKYETKRNELHPIKNRFNTGLARSIEESQARYAKVSDNIYFKKDDNAPKETIKLNDNLWISSSIKSEESKQNKTVDKHNIKNKKIEKNCNVKEKTKSNIDSLNVSTIEISSLETTPLVEHYYNPINPDTNTFSDKTKK